MGDTHDNETTTGAGTYGVGNAIRRREDPALITGEAAYTDDFSSDETVHMTAVRSQHAHARIENIDTEAVENRDDVVAVFTAEDLEASHASGRIPSSGDLPKKTPDFPLIASEKVRYVGDVVAVVVAEDRYAASTAADDVVVEYDTVDAVVTPEDALADDAPLIHEQYDDNCAFEREFGDQKALDEVFADAEHVVTLDIANPRVAPNAMEPRTAFAEYDPDQGRLTVRLSTQAPYRDRGQFADVLGLAEHRVRVIAPEVGGGFGSKGGAPYHAEPLTAWCSIQLERPVKWAATRTESLRSDHHGRDVHSRGELALDANGRMLGLRVDAEFNLGAYLVWGKTPAWNFRHLLSSQYDIPVIGGCLRGAFTNTTPVAPYRGAGRPESLFVTERLVGQAARELGFDPAELRRKNFIEPDEFPFETPTGAVYDSGNYERALDKALETVDYEAWRERQAKLREEGRYVGIGFSCFVENTGSGPGRPETGKVVLRKSGEAIAYCGTNDHGQGHRTTFAQVLADELGVDYDDIELREGDTKDLRTGVGTFGSRSAPVGASVLTEAAREIREQARRLAANQLEADPDDVEFDDGEFHVAGVPDRTIDIQTLAELSHVADDLPEDLSGGLEASTFYDPENLAYAFGTHVAVVELDSRTGDVEFHEYVAVDDCGTQFNPTIVEGQVHGGVAQGIGQALYEHVVFGDNGAITTGSFQDYAIPRAMHVPEMEVEETVTPCPHNPVGAKGVGESGSIGAPPAVVNAAIDALQPEGIETLDMPLTQETVWRAIHRR